MNQFASFAHIRRHFLADAVLLHEGFKRLELARLFVLGEGGRRLAIGRALVHDDDRVVDAGGLAAINHRFFARAGRHKRL